MSSQEADDIVSSCRAVVHDCTSIASHIPGINIIKSNDSSICAYASSMEEVCDAVDKFSRLTCNHYSRVKVHPPLSVTVKKEKLPNPEGFGVRGS